MASLQRSKSDVPAADRPSLARRATAGLVLTAAVAIGIYLVFSVIKAIVLFALVIAVIAAVLWALKTIVW
jgi:fatty acid desaturase